MKIVVTGASGFIGRRIVSRLQSSGHEVVTLGRSRNASYVWDAVRDPAPVEAFEGSAAVIHLAGEPVAQRWNQEVKWRIRESRIVGTKHVVEAIGKAHARPSVLVSSSAIGYYGDTGETLVDESAGAGSGFLAEVARGWEHEAMRAESFGIRVSRIRTGLVFGRGGGAFEEMLVPFRLGAGGQLASGQQWMSWIHIDDFIELLMFTLENPRMGGPVNGTSPAPVKNSEFTRALSGLLHRPAVLPIPKFALRLRFGEAAGHMVESSRVFPKKAMSCGFEFRFPEIVGAMQDLLAADEPHRRS